MEYFQSFIIFIVGVLLILARNELLNLITLQQQKSDMFFGKHEKVYAKQLQVSKFLIVLMGVFFVFVAILRLL